jgi:CheY-like chemotaxis protein
MASARVVLVDDVAAFRRLVGTALRLRGGFDVVAEAADGAGAVAAAAEHQPDIVVLDLGLPDLAGTEVIRLIRERSPRSKIVVFTGRDVDGESVRSVESVIRKDSDVRLLVDVLVDLTTDRGTTGAILQLEKDLASAARARAFVQDQCAAWGFDAVVDDALLIVSELVTNAVVHAESASELRLVPGEGILHIEVADDGSLAPDPRIAEDDDEHGRGLLLVGVLSAAWGTEATPSGKVVWADIPLAVDQSV